MRVIKLTEPGVRIGSSRAVYVNAENIAYFHEWTLRQYPAPDSKGITGDPVQTPVALITFSAASAEDIVSVSVLETPDEVASQINR